MDVNEIRTAAREMFGDTDSAQFTDTQLLTYINFALQETARRLGFQRTAATYLTMDGVNTEGIGGVDVPADFHQEIQLKWDGVRLSRMRYDDLFPEGDVITLTAGPPTHYAITPVDKTTGSRRFVFYPYVGLTQEGLVTVLYLARPAMLFFGADVPKVPVDLHMALVFYVCHLVAMSDDDQEKASSFKRMFLEQISLWEQFNQETGYNENSRVRFEDATALYYHDN